MSNPTLYIGALKTVRPAGAVAVNTRKAASCAQERYFSIPPEFAPAVAAWMKGKPHQSPCVAKNAASIIFVRDGQDGLETILTYRPGFSPLGTVAFPGGLCTADDAESIPWVGPSAEYWRDVFKHESVTVAHAAVVGAVRETFEEVGILLAGADELSTVEVSSDGCDVMAAREAVASEEKSFGDYLTKRGLKIRADLLRPLGRWQSPDFRHKRYDVHYFMSPAPVGQELKLLASKGVWGEWVNVRALLETRDSLYLGDRIDREETRGKTLEELMTPGSMCMLEDLAQAMTAVGYLAKKRTVCVKKADVVWHEGEYKLRFTAPAEVGKRDKCYL